jgi:signal transduction histidine kinase
MLDEIYDSIDDGLDNQKGLILQKLASDSTILKKNDFEEGDYAIVKTSPKTAKHVHDVYVDTLMYMQNEKDFEPVRLLRTMFQHNGSYYQMQVITSMVEEDDLIAELFYALLWLYLGLVGSILVLNNFLLKRIWRPFYYLLKKIKVFKLENPTELKLQKTAIDEFKLLNQTIQKLLQSNIDSYNSQKHFIENAAHELQTPLGIGINKLEVLAETARLTDEELKLLASALDNLERLTRLNKSLLLLSRIENRQFLTEEQINLNQLVRKTANDFADQIDYKKLSLNIDEPGALAVKMNIDLAVILVTNLLKNAIVHNYAHGLVNVIVDNGFLRIENTGKAEPLKEENLFKRFNKEPQAENSTGLGLAIVKAIADLYSFRISYAFAEKHILTVHF